MTLSMVTFIGMSLLLKNGLPISTVTCVTMPFSMVSVGFITPANVSIVKVVSLISPCSYAYLAKQRMPLPHISASLPSELMMRMRTSHVLDGTTITRPSAPIPVRRLQRRMARSV